MEFEDVVEIISLDCGHLKGFFYSPQFSSRYIGFISLTFHRYNRLIRRQTIHTGGHLTCKVCTVMASLQKRISHRLDNIYLFIISCYICSYKIF